MKKSEQVQSPPFLVVSNPQRLIGRCKDAIRDALTYQEWFGLEKRVEAKGGLTYILSSPWETRISGARDEDNTLKIIPITHNFWLATEISFEAFEARLRLRQISVAVLAGQMSDLLMEELFRAEWFLWERDGTENHAQPHWHLRPGTDILRLVSPSYPETRQEVREFDTTAQKSERSDFSPSIHHTFHFAMASSWHENGQHRIELNTEERVTNWFKSCLAYIVYELGSLTEREKSVQP